MTMKALRALALIATITAPAALPAAAQDLVYPQEPLFVTVDQARVMQISRPASTVIIGNPMIADAVIRDSVTLIITGRSFGTTNLIVLDDSGQAIADALITVEVDDQYLVTIYKRSSRFTFSCTPVCQPTIALGDEAAAFDARVGQVQGRNTLAE